MEERRGQKNLIVTTTSPLSIIFCSPPLLFNTYLDTIEWIKYRWKKKDTIEFFCENSYISYKHFRKLFTSVIQTMSAHVHVRWLVYWWVTYRTNKVMGMLCSITNQTFILIIKRDKALRRSPTSIRLITAICNPYWHILHDPYKKNYKQYKKCFLWFKVELFLAYFTYKILLITWTCTAHWPTNIDKGGMESRERPTFLKNILSPLKD